MSKPIIYMAILCLLCTSCIKKLNLYQGDDNDGASKAKEQTVVCNPDFFYPFDKEVKNIEAKITIHTHEPIPDGIGWLRTEIPPLKYNKEWLFMLTQDDCRQVAFSCTWAAINGRPLSNQYYYDLAHVQEGDFPPDIYNLGKTLRCTDGAGMKKRIQ